MKELRQIRDAVIGALEKEGLAAEAAFPSKWTGEGPLVTVAVGTMEGKNVGLSGYLGEVREPSGAVREVYGKRLAGTVCVHVWARGAAVCEESGERAAAVLLGALPAGIRPGELAWEGLSWDRKTGLFVRRGTLRCEALFLAEGGEETEEFLDFILKGVMRSEQLP